MPSVLIKYRNSRLIARLDKLLGSPLRTFYDSRALVQLQGLIKDYSPYSASSLRPSGLCVISNDILLNNRKTILEFGSGISTIIIASCIKQTGGNLITIEHDEAWLNIIRNKLRKAGLLKYVNTINAPLEDCFDGDNKIAWYKKSVVDLAILNNTFDLILVDGPPAYKKEWEKRRNFALKSFVNNLSSKAAIYLDDVDRRSERKIFISWCNTLTAKGTIDLLKGDIGAIHLGDRYNPFL